MAIAACQPGALRPDLPGSCPEAVPAPGEVQVGWVVCEQMTIPGGEEHIDDLWLANSQLRAVFRHPQASLGFPGVGGGTLIDAARWGGFDRLHEVAPLVDDGWLDIDDVELLANGIRLRGTVTALPDRPTAAEGATAEVSWVLEPDSSWLRIEGADGLWLHANGSYDVLDGWIWAGGLVYGHDGSAIEDLGGALRIDGATSLLVAWPQDALLARASERTRAISGTAAQGQRITVEQQGVVIGYLPVEPDGTFSGQIPYQADRIRAEADGRAASAWKTPGTNLSFNLGENGQFELRPAWSTDRSGRLRIAWTAQDGRAGVSFLPAVGGTLFLGKGAYLLEVSAGPTWWPATVAVETDPTLEPRLGVRMEARFDPGDRVLGAVGWPTDRSRTWRGTSVAAANHAHSLGAGWLVLGPEDDVEDVQDSTTTFPPLPHRSGSRSVSHDGWAVLSWPWTADLDRPGHGALDTRGMAPEDALAAVRGGVAHDRHTIVDLAWLEAAGPPWSVDPPPEGVLIEAPGPDGPRAWQPWFRWLDAAAPLAPVGPLAWFEVPDRENAANEDMEQALTSGRTQATTGPLLLLEAGGATPGGALDEQVEPLFARVEVLGASDLDHVALIGDHGNVLFQWPLSGEPDHWTGLAPVPAGRWLVAAAWDDEGRHFAATAPIWLDPP